MPQTLLSRSLRSIPIVLTAAVLAGVGAIGMATGWKIAPPAVALSSHTPDDGHNHAADDHAHAEWCADHGTTEATCIICRGLKVTESPPSKMIKGGTPIVEPPVEGKPRPVVQVPSAEVLRIAGVQVAPAELHALVETIDANAESGYDMNRYAQVGARAPGLAATVLVAPGDRVKKGYTLCLVDSAEVGKAKAELLHAAAALASKRAGLERITSSAAAGFRNHADQLAAEAEVREGSIRLFNARQALTSLGLSVPESLLEGVPSEKDVQFLGLPAKLISSLDPSITTANLLPVLSPLDGVIVSRSIVPGESVDLAKPLFVVSDTSHLWVTAELSPSDAVRVHINQELTFRPDGVGGEPIPGTIFWISTEVSDKTRTVQVRAKVSNPEGRLMARMFGRASITVASKSSALAVPAAAIQPDGTSSLVFVRLNEEVFRPRVVTVGLRAGGLVEVLSGLAAGERIATEGSYYLASQANRAKLGAGCCAD